MGDVPTDLQEGEGRVVGSIAYVRLQGEVRAFSTVCPHAGCDVEWNGSERTWDCPCHGSRFRADGSVLNGPTAEPLRPIKITHAHE